MIENLKSFTLNISQAFTFNSTSWNPTGIQFPWTAFDGSAIRKSDFNLEGFKNIEVYGFSLVGLVYPRITPASNQAIVQDWGVLLSIDGTTNLVNGFVGTNTFGVTQGGKSVFLSKYLNKYELNDPILSVKKITISALTANGIQYEVSNSVELVFDIAIIVYYKFEGE